jgi:hypothetical protein
MTVDRAEIERRMGYHPAVAGQGNLYEANREKAMELAEHFARLGPATRELSLALTALQEALMWANAHIACNDLGVSDDGDLG